MDKYAGQPDQFLEMLTKFWSTWDGNLGQMNTGKRRIKVTLWNSQLIPSATYRAGTVAQEFEEADIYKIKSQKVIEPTETELAAPIAFVPRKTDPFSFA